MGCSFSVDWQCAMQLGVNIPTAGFDVSGANAARKVAPDTHTWIPRTSADTNRSTDCSNLPAMQRQQLLFCCSQGLSLPLGKTSQSM
eukprot:m.46447 g.46447  ORF g.46447 m.46447 type:complete len:87 (-) comp15159_c0_seq8:179-439(-)